MQVILLERVENLGQMGDEVNVKPGFARNFLLPQKKALRATDENRAYFESQRKQIEAENLRKKQEAEKAAEKLKGRSVVLIRQAGDTGQLYGSVAPRDIVQALSDDGVSIGRNQVVLDRPIKLLGVHPVRIRLHPEVSETIDANVARSEQEAELQARGVDIVASLREEAGESEAEAEAETEAEAEQAEAAPAEAEETAGEEDKPAE